MRRRLWFACACVLAAIAPLLAATRSPAAAHDAFPGWPGAFEGRHLTALPLSRIEERFAKDFPGRIARFSDGGREVILRWVAEGTRRLHPATDCFRANGYEVRPTAIRTKGKERWSSFIATRGTQQFEVEERIVDASGAQWSDASSWYWAVQLGQTHGPWWAVTTARSITPAVTPAVR